MNQDTPPDERAASLRQRAEEQARSDETRELAALSPEEIRLLLHELRVHQIELEMQNEELRRAQLELEASRARYFDLYDLAPVGYLSVSQAGLIQEANLTAATLLGVTRAALVRQPLTRYILSEDQDIYYRHRKQLFDTGEPPVCELRLLRADEVPLWARLEATVTQEEGGALACRVVLSDITERKQAEEALRASEDKFSAAFRANSVPLAITTMAGQWVDVNRAFCSLLGYTREELLGKTSAELGIVDAAIRRDILTREHIAGSLKDTEVEVHDHKGNIHIILASAETISLNGVPHRITTNVDITERKQAEEEREQLLAQIREQARRVQAILDTVPEGVLLLDADRRVRLANPAAQEALALLAESAPDQPLTRLGDRPLAELLTLPRGLRHEVRAGGRTFEVLAHPIPDDDESQRWVLAVEDVTQEREVRARLAQQERLAAVGQLAAGMAHDINNALSTVLLSAQIVQRSPNLSDKERGYLAAMLDRVGVATKLIGQILDFGRRSYLERAPVDLLHLLQELLASLESSLPANIRLELTADCDEYIVLGDAARLQQAILNLAANARDAMPGGGRLQFALSLLAVAPDAPPPLPDLAAGDWVRLAVSDSGVGIAAEHLPLLFEPFFTTKEPGEGTGLGLPQVYGLVKQHGGAIAVRSEPGAGATFSIYLPLLRAPTLQPARGPAEEPPAPATPGSVPTILLVEHEATLREVVAATLQDLGYRVLPAASGAEALTILTQADQAIDLLLSDSSLPRMSGLDLFQAAHRQQETLKAVLMSDGKESSPGLPDVDWLEKPFELEVLAAKIQGMLPGGAPPGGRGRWRREGG